MKRLLRKVTRSLSDDLLSSFWRKEKMKEVGPVPRSWGHCYVAAEAFFHLAGGKAAGMKPMRMRWEDGPHWFVLGPGGEIYDPTVDQFKTIPDYSLGVGCGFLTREPSSRARRLMERVK